MKNIALFDFDGTIIKGDSMFKFIKFSSSYLKYYAGLIYLIPFYFLYLSKIINNQELKEYFLAFFFKGMDSFEFETIARKFSLTEIDKCTKNTAIAKINWHKHKGDKVVIVSASIIDWIKPWCDRSGIDIISTELEKSSGILTGKIRFKNCYGQEKVNRILKKYDISIYNKIYAYGDSKGDKEMLQFANIAFYQIF